ncbi:serine hydrolase [Algoriphagus resistens]|uniref:serine hydrolase n=1 Tax=Algoriphagus resistens TaxID=1750590 RepID=UPI000716A963|nr:serine hydrolase [Algoriphagus resistens]
MKKQLVILLAFGLALNSYAQTNGDMNSENKIKAIDDFLTRYEKLNKFNGTVLVAYKDQVLIDKGYGYADFETKAYNDSQSIFQIYSITKTFTSTMIFELIEQGKLSLDDRLSKFYPSFPNGETISIGHLLNHTSGINDHSEEPDAPATEAYRVELFGKNEANFPPGEGWSYCNGGYQLLGYIIAKVTGMTYEEAIRETIFNPLAMSSSGFDFKNLSRPEKVTAYHVFTEGIKEKAILYDSVGPYAAGSIYSTVGDLYKYYKSFGSHRILSEASQEIAFSPSKTNKNYGHGWQLQMDSTMSRIISHSGGAAGFRSNFAMIEKDDACVIILNNHENANPEFLTRRIIDLLNDKTFQPVKEMKLNAEELGKFVGAFSIQEPQLMLYTSILDGRLAIDVGGQGKQLVIATDQHTFIQEEADAVLKFIKDENNQYSELHIIQGSRKMIAKRIESSWGVTGTATAKGWDDAIPDIKFSEDKGVNGRWILENITLMDGDMKFRLNNDWNINYGDNQGDKILDMHGENIKMEAGVYDIILDLTDDANPHYSIVKKN